MEPEPQPTEPKPTPDTSTPKISALIPRLTLPPLETQPSSADLKTANAWVDAQLTRIGVCRREREARMLKVPTEIQAVLPVAPVQALLSGVLPDHGFGLGGGVGKGKTMALAAILRSAIQRFALNATFPMPDLRGFNWCSWPEEAAWFSAHPSDADDRVERLSTVRLLVLDDLGRERVKGSYVDDWALTRLDLIVSRRNRECLPILWTSNLNIDGLKALYGGSFVSRLTQDNPLIWID